jgi:serine phosphatase RsbU (regulator of sigma subunit)/ligand-binding sensor protein
MIDFIPSEDHILPDAGHLNQELLSSFFGFFVQETGFTLAVFDPEGRQLSPLFGENQFCLSLMRTPHREKCLDCHQEAFLEAKSSLKPVISQCYLGLSNFVVPITGDNGAMALLSGGMTSSRKPSALLKKQLNLLKSLPARSVEQYYRVPVVSSAAFADRVSQVEKFAAALAPLLRQQAFSSNEIKNSIIHIGEALGSALNLNDLLKLIVDLCIRLIDADAGSIYLLENRNLITRVSVGLEETPRPGGSNAVPRRRGGAGTSPAGGKETALQAPASPSSQPFMTYLGIPLGQKDDARGILNLYSRRRRDFNFETARVLSFFIAQAGLAIENAQIFENEKQRAREISNLYHAVRIVEESRDHAETLNNTAKQMARLAEVNRCLLMLADEKGTEFKMRAGFGLSDEQKDFFFYFSIPVKQVEEAYWHKLREGKPIILDSPPPTSQSLEKLFTLLPSNCLLILPIYTGKKLMGLIFLDDSEGLHHFTPPQVRSVMTLCIHATTAIQRALLLAKQEQNLRHLNALYQVSSTITQILSPSKVAGLIVEKACHIAPISACALMTWDEKKKSFAVNAHYGLSPEEVDLPLFDRISAQASHRKKHVFTSLLDEKDQYAVINETQFGGILALPLNSKKRVLGVLLCLSHRNRPFGSDEITLLKSFSHQAAIAMENARLYGIIKDKVHELATLFEVGKSITSTLKLPELLDEIASIVLKVMKADASSIFLLDHDAWELYPVALRGLGKNLASLSFPVSRGSYGMTLRTGSPLAFYDSDNGASSNFPEEIRREGFKTVLSAPLTAKGKGIGVISIYRKDLHPFDESEVNLLMTLGNQAAMSIENALLYQEQYEMAQELQTLLMPQSQFSFPGLKTGHIYLPSKELSGDYYELIPLGGSKVGITISDVSGKGTPAAVYTARGKYILKSYASANYPPNEVLRMINTLMSNESEGGKFITIFYAVADLQNRELTFSNAGHPPPVFWDASREKIKLLKTDDILIGVDGEAVFSQHKITFSSGDLLVLYTDGITDSRSPDGEMFDIEKLKKLVQKNAGLDPQILADKILASVNRFSRRRLTDDFTLLILRF